MSQAAISNGFRQISRHDGIFQERVHDAYKANGKLPEPTICPQCGAVFHEGRWQWRQAPASAHRATCPACYRIHDRYPAGFLTLQGELETSVLVSSTIRTIRCAALRALGVLPEFQR